MASSHTTVITTLKHVSAMKLKTEWSKTKSIQRLEDESCRRVQSTYHPSDVVSISNAYLPLGPCFVASLWLYMCPSWLTNGHTLNTSASGIAGSSGQPYNSQRKREAAKLNPQQHCLLHMETEFSGLSVPPFPFKLSEYKAIRKKTPDSLLVFQTPAHAGLLAKNQD